MTQRKKGFSLIEVVIALAIFVIGALAIIRIFPTGLGLVEKSGNTQRASNLNRSITARMQRSNAIPAAIFNGNFSTALSNGNHLGTWFDFNGAVAGSAKFNNTLPKSVKSTDLTTSALDNFRAIRGEQSEIKSGGSTGAYALTQFSIEPVNVAVYSEDRVENVSINNAGLLDWTNATLKSTEASFVPVADPNTIFYVSYRYKDGTRVWGVDDEPVISNALTTSVIRNTGVVTGGVEVSVRKFVGNVDLSPTAPSPLSNETRARARCGVLDLPVTSTIGQKISIDYLTNWYWILEELVPSTQADAIFTTVPSVPQELRQVELSVPFVRPRSKDRFAAVLMNGNGSGTHYTAIYDGGGLTQDPNVPLTPRVVFPKTTNTSTDAANLRNALREGKIAFDVSGISQPIVRVAYKTQDDWVQQLSVSAKSYKRYVSTAPANYERWRDYALDTNALIFHASEAGKAVRVTYSYSNSATPADPLADTTKTELLTIGSQIQTGNQLGASLPVVSLALNPPSGSNVTAIQSIKGASITARTAWMTSDKYSHNLLTSMRGDS